MMNTMNKSYIHLTSLFMHTLINFYANLLGSLESPSKNIYPKYIYILYF